MSPSQLKENIEDNIIRLKRQYAICSANYDRAALKDLAHVLRVWMDMSNEVHYYLEHNKPKLKFTAFGIKSEFTNTYRGYEYLVTAFPNKVFFYGAHNIENIVHSDSLNRMFATTWDFRYENMPDGRRQDAISCFMSVYKDVALSEQEAKTVNCGQIITNKTKFRNWLNSIAIRVRRRNMDNTLTTHDISRNDIIRRVANILGGSHPEGGVELNYKQDPIIREIMGNKIFGMPLPNLILLKIAQDILQAFE